MRLDRQNLSANGEPKRGAAPGVSTDGDETVIDKSSLSQEFFDLIYAWDPEAANDDYYVTSSDFVELHSQIRTGLVQGLLFWAIVVCVVMTGLTFLYSWQS